MGKSEPKAKAKAEAEPPPPAMPEPPAPKPRATLKQLNGWRDDLVGVLGELDEVATDDPYLTDAKAFATQARACLEKQIVAEGGDRLPDSKPS